VNQNHKPIYVEIVDDPFLARTNCTHGLIAPLLDKKNPPSLVAAHAAKPRLGL